MEQMASSSLMRGIESTGDGTRANAFLVSRTSDEYDLLLHRELIFTGQSLVAEGDRKLDVMRVEAGEENWFDVTDIQQILNRHLGFGDGD